MTPRERVEAVLAGRPPDRPPLSFWHHFPPDQVYGPAAVQAHRDHLAAFELDFLKVMNDNGYPHAGPVERVGDLAGVGALRGNEPEFARQLDLLSDLRAELGGRVLLTTTLFNSWAVLRHLVRPPTVHRPPHLDAAADEPSRRLREWLAADESLVRTALGRISANLARFAQRCLAAGADGIFLSVRDDWLDGPDRGGRYAGLVRPGDLEILAAAAEGCFNFLHVCGRPVDFAAFAQYPVHVLHWADRAAGPAMAAVVQWVRPAICGGVDNLRTLPHGTPEDCEREVADALRQAGGRPILIAPGCTYDPEGVPRANLAALRAAVLRLSR